MKKKQKLLLVILIVQAVILVAGIVAAVFLMPNIMLFDNSDKMPNTVVNGIDSDVHNGYADVTLYGAVADDGEDDTEAFINAAKTGANVYVPLGTFDIKETVNLKGQSLKGGGIDRSVIRFNGKGTITKLSGAAMIEDITLTFAEGTVSGDEIEGEQVAIYDDGITNGAMLRAVKAENVGTGYYSKVEAATNLSVSIESLIINKFSYKAIEIKDANATLLRTLNIGESIGKVDAAVSLCGSFTLESIAFNKTECNYPLEFLAADSAVVKSVVFNGVKAESGSLIKSVSSVLSIQVATVKETPANALIKIEDSAEQGETIGNIISFWSDSKMVIDTDNRINCDSNVSQ